MPLAHVRDGLTSCGVAPLSSRCPGPAPPLPDHDTLPEKQLQSQVVQLS
jgi:hypothetical protein